MRPLRALVYGGAAAGPLLWLLLPALLDGATVPGLAGADVYGWLHAAWANATGASVVVGFPEAVAPPSPDLAGRLLAPVVRLAGAPAAYEALLAVGAVATMVATWALARRELGGGWPAAAATAVSTASAPVLAGLANGQPEAVHGWALAALPLVRGWGAVPLGIAAGALAPGFLPPALLLAVREARIGTDRARFAPAGAWAIGVAVALLQGLPTETKAAVPGAWFVASAPGTLMEEVVGVYLGWLVAAGILAAAFTPERRSWGLVGVAALGGAAVASPLGPDRFLVLATLAGALGGIGVVVDRTPAWRAAASVWLGVLALVEGAKGVAVEVPLPRASVVVAEPARALPEGPVVELPVTRASAMRALWDQTAHGRPVAATPDGRLPPIVAQAGLALQQGQCPDLGAAGFATVLARREADLRELGALVRCWGTPAADDGVVARWDVRAGGAGGAGAAFGAGGDGAAGAGAVATPGAAPTPAPAGSGSPAPGP